MRTAGVKIICTVATRAKRRRKGELVSGESKIVLTCPVTKLCFLEMD